MIRMILPRNIRRGQRTVDMVIEDAAGGARQAVRTAERRGAFRGQFPPFVAVFGRVLDRPDDWDNVEFMKTKREVALAVRDAPVASVRQRVARLIG
jgi:hypothetical protein